jgi:glycosyltransferase involved in cell wall biosynthesis
MRILQIGSDRSKRGILVPGSPAYKRQEGYAAHFGELDIIGFSLRTDGFAEHQDGGLHTIPTNSRSKIFFGLDGIRIASTLKSPSVVSAQDPFETGLLAICIAWMLRAPLHVQVHTDFLSPEYTRHSMLNRVRVLVAGFVLRRAKRIRVVSERIKASLTKRYRTLPEISVLPIFTDIHKVTPEIDAATKGRLEKFSTVVLVVARLEAEKNVELAIGAFSAASPLDACLVIVGEGSERARLEVLARASSAHERIFFEGERDASSYYAHTDLVLVTSRYEGYGLVIIESLARGIPVISTDVGVAREAGAIVAHEQDLDSALNDWFRTGPREGHLNGYPYANREEYTAAYCADIVACARA